MNKGSLLHRYRLIIIMKNENNEIGWILEERWVLGFDDPWKCLVGRQRIQGGSKYSCSGQCYSSQRTGIAPRPDCRRDLLKAT